MTFFKKALGIFVEFDESAPEAPKVSTPVTSSATLRPPANTGTGGVTLTAEDVTKFEKHFTSLLETGSSTKPNYQDFCKMVETLEPHIPDEKARMQAAFASMKIMGLSKEKLITTATATAQAITTDKARFEEALQKTGSAEIERRQQSIKSHEQVCQRNRAEIERLTAEIGASGAAIVTLTTEIGLEEAKLTKNRSGYVSAADALLTKINSDLETIKNNL